MPVRRISTTHQPTSLASVCAKLQEASPIPTCEWSPGGSSKGPLRVSTLGFVGRAEDPVVREENHEMPKTQPWGFLDGFHITDHLPCAKRLLQSNCKKGLQREQAST